MTVNNSTNQNSFEILFGENSFFNLFFKLKKYKEFYPTNKMNILVFFLTIGITLLFNKVFFESLSNDELLKNISLYLGSSFLGLLGFTIAGLSLIVNFVSNKMIDSINSDDSAIELIDLLYSFYFLGFLCAILSSVYFCLYIVAFLPGILNKVIAYILTFILIYLTIFTIFFSVEMLKLALQILVLNYIYSKSNSILEIVFIENYTEEEVRTIIENKLNTNRILSQISNSKFLLFEYDNLNNN